MGSHGGATFSRNKGGAFVRTRIVPTHPATANQGMSKVAMVMLSKYWSSTLTPSQRAAWNTYAATNPTVNRVGATTLLSGHQMFIKLNGSPSRFGDTILASPPTSNAVGSVASIGIVAVSGSPGSLHVTIHESGATGTDFAIVLCSPPLSPGKFYVSSQLRQIGHVVTLGSSVPLTSPYNAQFGDTPTSAGQQIILRVAIINTANYIVSAYQQASSLWT